MEDAAVRLSHPIDLQDAGEENTMRPTVFRSLLLIGCLPLVGCTGRATKPALPIKVTTILTLPDEVPLNKALVDRFQAGMTESEVFDVLMESGKDSPKWVRDLKDSQAAIRKDEASRPATVEDKRVGYQIKLRQGQHEARLIFRDGKLTEKQTTNIS